jgi:hypothetical protein
MQSYFAVDFSPDISRNYDSILERLNFKHLISGDKHLDALFLMF